MGGRGEEEKVTMAGRIVSGIKSYLVKGIVTPVRFVPIASL